MKIFDLFKREKKKQTVVNNIISVLDELSQSTSLISPDELTFDKAIEYYLTVAPLADSIDILSDSFAKIPIVIQDENGEFIYNHPVLDLLNLPNADITDKEFKKSLAAYFALLGNTFIEATGDVRQAPKELYSRPPQFMNIYASKKDGFPEYIEFQSNILAQNYYRKELNNRYRFYSKTGLNEMWHIRDFNPRYSFSRLFGSIPISSIATEIEQYARSSNHNLSLLKNGARLSAILLKEGILTDDQYRRLKEQFNSNYVGDTNAGKVMVAESGDGKLDLKELSQSNRDMDFRENKKDVKLMIYGKYKIPLPLVSPDHMTMSNYTEARLALYDEAVLPLTDRILQELTLFLFPRYKDLEGKKLTYNPQDITALQARANEDVAKKVESNVLSPNEIRELYGYDPIANGESVYQPLNLVPLGTPIQENQVTADKDRFKEILKKAGYKNDEIEKAVRKYYN